MDTDFPQLLGRSYGRHGNPTTYALEEAFAVMEGADNACAVSSGVAAINAALLAFVKVWLFV
jgi:cystathionine beta-lyase/cystathionine gamma-synthase